MLFTLFLVVLLGSSALTVDYGSWLLFRRSYQNVADAAALVGVAQLTRPRTDPCTGGTTKATCARQAAWTSVKQQLGLTALDPTSQGTANSSSAYQENGYRIWVDTPPSAAPAGVYPGTQTSNGMLFVHVERDNPSYFSHVFGQGDRTVSAWATAGLLPNRFAILGLCPKSTTSNCPQAQDVKLSGTNTTVTVINGDLGSDWGLTVTSSGPGVVLPGDSQAWLVDYDKCASATWACPPNISGGIEDPGPPAVAKVALKLDPPAPDPSYVLPSWLTDPTAVPDRPDFNADSLGNAVNPDQANVSCDATSTILGPGSYNTINVKKGCVILDPTFGLALGQRPGIFRIKHDLTLGNGAFAIGDGVTIFLDGTQMTCGSCTFGTGNGGGIVINTGNAGHPERKYGAWTTAGATPWSVAALPLSILPTYNTTMDGVGMAFYVIPPNGGTSAIFNMSGSTGLSFRGVLYGPKDVINIGGSSGQASAGQIVGWTIRYNGNTNLVQTYEGVADERPYLIEPTLGQ